MTAVEWVVAGALLVMGARSALYWIRRPLDSIRLVDHVLFALFVTSRVGLWLAFAGFFALSASSGVQGRAFTDTMAAYRWYALVPIALAVAQLLSGFFLGRMGGGGSAAHPPEGEAP